MKMTFSTLKAQAKAGKLKHHVISEYDGTDTEQSNNVDNFKITTLEDLKKFKATKNYFSVDGKYLRLDNCIYSVNFKVFI